MFYKQIKEDMITILIVYVVDIIATGNNVAKIGRLQGSLAKDFKIKDLGIEIFSWYRG